MVQTDACGIVTMTLDKTNFTPKLLLNTVTLKVTDVNGNSATETAIVTVEDVPVVLTKSITVQLNAAGNCSIVAADVNNGSTDACGIATMTLDKTTSYLCC
jgi:2-phospho-L-lactate guanylyltransferase (CobY/MobA/RfbA family)